MTMCLFCLKVSQRKQAERRAYPGQPKEVGIRMRATLRSVDLVEMFQRELELRCEPLDTRTEIAFWERR